MIRKQGKLPGPTICYEYDLEYGTDVLEIQEGIITLGQRVVVLDDLLATGYTINTAVHLIHNVEAENHRHCVYHRAVVSEWPGEAGRSLHRPGLL
ncbi:MAG: adenine phosphoribosyltransferase [Rhodospirillaceae bacterium]|nr:MAG: adenine phosphoribosyltransferase [Rhodospirillaceae bacterium]